MTALRDGEEAPGPEADTEEVAAPLDFSDRAKQSFPIVGIGASAGGLQAISEFLKAMPADSGMAFIIVQHLPPDRDSLMVEILSRHTAMPVRQIEDAMSVDPDHVYVIRPGYTVTVGGGVLHLGAPVEQRGHRRPVDDFFRSLALEQKEKSIAIILSGMGTNGTSGAQAIKAAGGLCLAQEPGSAEFPSMPQSLIHAGYADQVLEAAEMPSVLLQYIRHPYLGLQQSASQHAETILLRERQHLNEIFAILRTRSGHDFTGYKKPTVLRRVQRRMGLASTTALAQYAARLRDDSAEVQALANDLMINVTGFFRDAGAWEELRMVAVRPLIEQRASGSSLRAWVTACSSGEEAYSLAMLLAEETERAGKHFEIKIFATDTADKSLGLARAGIYPTGIEGDLSLARLDRFFEKQEYTYRICKDIRELVVFADQDVLRDPPFSKVDICTCRNLLIYLEPEMQQRVLMLLHFSLREGGYLFLGNAETPGNAEQSFESMSKKWRIYRRRAPARPAFGDLTALSTRALPEVRRADAIVSPLLRASSASAVQQAMLERFAPPSIVVDRHDRIVYFHGDLSAYLIQPSGEPTRNLFELLRPPLRAMVRGALRQAAAGSQPVQILDIELASSGRPHRIKLSVSPLGSYRLPEHFCVGIEVQAEVEASSQPAAHLPALQFDGDTELESELLVMRRELQSTVEAFEASNEELKASNEEVISINEELQSANEELETGKEELQSLNEELTTVNGQLQAKIVEIDATNNDLSNLLSSTSIAVLFLDTQLRVRRYTPAMNDLLELIPGDIGRPIAHLAQKFSGSDLVADARSVLARLIPLEAEVYSASAAWYLRRTLPYRTIDNRIDGVVVTFIDITNRKHAEQALAVSQARLQAVIEQMPAAILLVEAPSGKVLLGNRSMSKLFGVPFPPPFIGTQWSVAASALTGYRAGGQPYLSDEWPLARTLASRQRIDDEEIEIRTAEGTGTLLVSSTPIFDRPGEMVAAVAGFWDITARKAAAEALRESEERYRLLIESAIDYAIFTSDPNGRITSWNAGAERLLGWSEKESLGRPVASIFTAEDQAAGKHEEDMQQAMQEGRASGVRLHVRKDGSRFWSSGVLIPLTDGKSAIRGFAKIMRDNTERQQAEESLQKALRASEAIRATVESADRAKDEFISTVSHELRTPLNTIRLWSRMLSSGRVPQEEWGEGIRIIDRAAIAQQQLIDDLLDVARMASGKLRLAMRPTRLSQAVKGAIEAIQPSADARKITIIATSSEQVGVVRADPDRIQQVVWNLLSNAVKFTPSEGRIEVSLERHAEDVIIAVADSGIGIRQEFLPHVFDRFRQAELSTTRQHGGLGLGLAIAKQLVELHGGTLSAHSDGEGRGATFSLRLPLRPLANHTGEDQPNQTAAIHQTLHGLHVLLVEDDVATREATVRLLEMHGARVQAVAVAAAALDAYSALRPMLIVSDIGLPGEDGFALIRQIRLMEEDRGLQRVPALALTAFARADDQRRALAAGFDVHIAKPVNTEVLLAAIQRFAATQ